MGLLSLLVAALPAAVMSMSEMLSDADFEERVSKEKMYMVAFTAPWCGHCKRMAPAWDDFAAAVSSDEGLGVRVGKVDCTVSRDTCTAQNIRGYPTVLLFKDGATSGGLKYSGTRDVASFVSFVQANKGE